MKVREGRKVVDDIVSSEKVVYGINTGFGNFANVAIPHDKLRQLQANLIRSHAVGIGSPMPLEIVRSLAILRVNVLAKGHSGITPESLKALLNLINKNTLPLIPSQGTVGASGDLCPLAHLALGLIGEGKIWDPKTQKYDECDVVFANHNVQKIELKAKEGLALINGTQFMSAVGVEALCRAKMCAKVADLAAAFSVEVLQGTYLPFTKQIHEVRPHKGFSPFHSVCVWF